jgi:catechol 2,3-dioxygenase-like lactoylglutathione lyase family enzyme
LGLDGHTPLALDHVQVAAPAGCEAQARRFYGELLGLTELDKPAALSARAGAWFALAGAQLHVGVADPFVPAVQAHPALRAGSVEALERVAARLSGAGVAVAWDGALPGVRRFFTADPWGNRLEVLARDEQPPAR